MLIDWAAHGWDSTLCKLWLIFKSPKDLYFKCLGRLTSEVQST